MPNPSMLAHADESAAARPWLKQPGEVCDKKGVPIHPGDLLRSFHFRQRWWRKKHYLYHTAVYREGAMRLIPTCHLEPTRAGTGGDCLLSDDLGREAEVINGCGPGGLLCCTDRPKRKAVRDA